jgi:HAD superfamily phosphatase (TIGR01668 family)
MLSFIAPHHRIGSVCELSLDRLRELGLDALLLDVDSTLKRYSQEHFEPGVLEWLDEIRQGGIALCLLSNGMGSRIGRVAEQLQLPFVAKACKPLPRGCHKAMRMIGASPGRTAMVGDQLFADIIAGRLAGLTSILVRPIHPEEEHWFTRMKRPAEQLLLGWMKRGS